MVPSKYIDNLDVHYMSKMTETHATALQLHCTGKLSSAQCQPYQYGMQHTHFGTQPFSLALASSHTGHPRQNILAFSV